MSAGTSPAESAAVDRWVDWEEAVLCSTGTQAESREAACQHLETELASRDFLISSGFSMADVVVAASLLPHEQACAAEVLNLLQILIEDVCNNNVCSDAVVKAARLPHGHKEPARLPKGLQSCGAMPASSV